MQAIKDGLQNQRDALEIGALSLNIVVLLLHSRRVYAHVERACRSLYKDCACPGREEAVKEIENEISELEILERRLAVQYKLAEDIDSVDFDTVEVFGEAKSRALAKTGANCEEDLRKLGRLHDLRLKLARLQQSASEIMSTGSRTACIV